MSKILYRAIAAIFFLSIAGGGCLYAQVYEDIDRGRLLNTGEEVEYDRFGNPIDPYAEEGAVLSDSTKVKKPKLPLESYFFSDSIRARNNFLWNLNTRMNRVEIGSIDTLMNGFQIDYPFMKKDVGDAYMGNLGAGSMPLNFFRRPDSQDFSFTNPFYAYMYTPENVPFYNVKRPFTQLSYSTSGQKKYVEEIFSLIHAQNISPSMGFNLTYHTNKTKGSYRNQATNDTNLSAAFSYTGKRYSAHAGYIWNKVDNFENGGVVDDWHITSNTHDLAYNVPMMLGDQLDYTAGTTNKARSIINGNTFYTVHSYGFPLRGLTEEDFTMADVPAFYLGYSFQYSRMKRRYTDTYAAVMNENIGKQTTGTDEDPTPGLMPHYPNEPYYDKWYINPSNTRDSISETLMSNRFFVQIQPWDRNGIVGTIDAGIGLDNHRYYMFRPSDYITGAANNVSKENSVYIYGAIEGKLRRYFDWGGSASFTPIGYRSGDLEVQANAQLSLYIKERPVSLSGSFSYSNKTPSFWVQEYISNHYVWRDRHFDREKETRLDVRLDVPHIDAEVSLHQSILTDKIYYGPDVIPMQENSAVSITGIYGRKDFSIGGLHLNNRLLLQWSTDQKVVPVPAVSVYLSYYYEFNIVRNVLRMQIGLDGRYNTRYNGFAYNPAIGQFYNQDEKQIGGYPVADAFISAKWKRMRIRLKYTHLNENMFDNRDSFMILHHPLNRQVFKIGISWGFYD